MRTSWAASSQTRTSAYARATPTLLAQQDLSRQLVVLQGAQGRMVLDFRRQVHRHLGAAAAAQRLEPAPAPARGGGGARAASSCATTCSR